MISSQFYVLMSCVHRMVLQPDYIVIVVVILPRIIPILRMGIPERRYGDIHLHIQNGTKICSKIVTFYDRMFAEAHVRNLPWSYYFWKQQSKEKKNNFNIQRFY